MTLPAPDLSDKSPRAGRPLGAGTEALWAGAGGGQSLLEAAAFRPERPCRSDRAPWGQERGWVLGGGLL